MQYSIKQYSQQVCYLQSVELKGNNNYKITICHFCDNKTNKHIFDYVMNGDHCYHELLNEVRTKKLHSVYLLTIVPMIPVYHKITWQDVNMGLQSRQNLGEIQKDSTNRPIVFNELSIYAYIDGQKDNLTPNYILDKEYIAVNHPYIDSYLNYNNMAAWYARCERERQESYDYDGGDESYGGWTQRELEDAADAAYEGYSRLYLGLD